MLALRKILIGLVILFCIVFIADWTLGSLLRTIYFKQNHGFYYKITYAIEKMDAPFVIYGSSRASHHYISNNFEKEFQMPVYNAGSDGNFIFFQQALLTCSLKRYKPKTIILDLLDDEFLKNSNRSYERLNILLPYCKDYPEIKPIVNLKSPFEKYKTVSKIYPFNSLLAQSVTGWLDFHKKRVTDTLAGFDPLHGSWNENIEPVKYKNLSIDKNKVNAFKSFVNMCKAAGITLYVFVSPGYGLYDKTNSTIEIAEDFTHKNGYLFHNYLSDTTFINHPGLFKDIRHLNTEGAALYTQKIIEQIKHG